MNPRIPQHKEVIEYLKVKYPLQLIIYNVHPVTQQYESKTFWRVCL